MHSPLIPDFSCLQPTSAVKEESAVSVKKECRLLAKLKSLWYNCQHGGQIESLKDGNKVSYLVSWCFEPSQPQRVTSSLLQERHNIEHSTLETIKCSSSPGSVSLHVTSQSGSQLWVWSKSHNVVKQLCYITHNTRPNKHFLLGMKIIL